MSKRDILTILDLSSREIMNLLENTDRLSNMVDLSFQIVSLFCILYYPTRPKTGKIRVGAGTGRTDERPLRIHVNG